MRTLCSRAAIWTALGICLVAKIGAEEAPQSPPKSASTSSELRIGELRVGRVLILGNSITLHGPSEKIGWSGNWGMAASAAEKDYVHILLAKIAKAAGGQPQTLVKNIADFERQYATYDVAGGLKPAIDFHADLVVLAVGENVPALQSDEEKAAFQASMSRLIAELTKDSKPTVIVRSCFWPNAAKDDALKVACEASGGVYVDIGALGRDEANFARSERKFEHAGVAAHPGDRGMQAIADALWKAIEATSKK